MTTDTSASADPVAALILSPLGRASGGHMNPAVSFARRLLGVFPRRAVVPGCSRPRRPGWG
jgi:glycerol uptake facilitator protein/aquaporin Z